MNKIIPLSQVIGNLAKITETSETISETFLKELFVIISDSLANGETVKVKNIGTFIPSKETGDVVFEPDKEIASAINQPFACFEPVELNDGVTEEILSATVPETPVPPSTPETEVPLTEVPMIDAENGNDDGATDINLEDVEKPAVDPDSFASEEITQAEKTPEEENQCQVSPSTNPDVQNPDALPQEPSSSYSKWWGGIIIGFLCGLICGYLTAAHFIPNDDNPIDKAEPQEQTTAPLIKQADTSQTAIDSTSIAPISPKQQVSETINKEVTDTIRRNRFLTTMARKYYGDMRFWVYIYEENSSKLGHPDHVKPGIVVQIPDAAKYGVDKDNPTSVLKAERKAIEIYGRYE